MNIKPGEKLTEFCSTFECVLYNLLVTISNNSNLKGYIKCPKIFCDRFKNQTHKCKTCGNAKLLIHGHYNDNNEFCCYSCPEEKQIEIEVKTPQIEEEGKNINTVDKLKKMEELIFSLCKNKNFLKNYLDTTTGEYIWYNPMNQSPNPMVWSEGYFTKTDYETLKNELLNFFKTYLDKFQEAKDCKGCECEETFCQHMVCIDCSRNEHSFAMIKRDRYKAKK